MLYQLKVSQYNIKDLARNNDSLPESFCLVFVHYAESTAFGVQKKSYILESLVQRTSLMQTLNL